MLEVKIDWVIPNVNPSGVSITSPEFFSDGSSTFIATAELAGRKYSIFTEGDMEIVDNTEDGKTYYCSDDLFRAGIDTDKILGEFLDTAGVEIRNNPWFAIYDGATGEEVVDVFYDISDISDILRKSVKLDLNDPTLWLCECGCMNGATR